YGEDGSIQEVLALLGVPFVGAAAEACRFAFDKPVAKAVAHAAGLATPASVTLPKETFHDLGATAVVERIVTTLGLPLFVKPARGDGGGGPGARHYVPGPAGHSGRPGKLNDGRRGPAAAVACTPSPGGRG